MKKALSLLLAITILFSAMAVGLSSAAFAEGNETLTVYSDETSGTVNIFKYSTGGAAWTVIRGDSYATVNSSNYSSTYYEVVFVGNKIELYCNKSHNHGKIIASVDGGQPTEIDLYNSSRTNPQVVYTAQGLSEGQHTLKVVSAADKNPSSSTNVNQVAYAVVTHAPYNIEALTVTNPNVTIYDGQESQIAYTCTPAYATVNDMVYESSNTAVATVSKTGLITAKGAGSAVITLSTPSYPDLSATVNVTVNATNPSMGATIVDSGMQYVQTKYNDIKAMNVTSESLTAWKNDAAVSQIVVYSKDSALHNVTVSANDFTSGENTLNAENITATFIKSVQAYNGFSGYHNPGNPVPTGNRVEASEVLYQTSPADIGYSKLQPVWINIDVPKEQPAGTYTGVITVSADGVDSIALNYTLEVQDAVLPDAEEFSEGFDIELWQNPFASAEYYDVEPFSEDHLKILRPIMEKYKSIGGHAITTTIVDEAWNGQTYSANEVHYPSMVKWTKKSDGSFEWDYEYFDTWVTLNKEIGIADKIICYSIAPWHNSFKYYDEASARNVTLSFSAAGADYERIWKLFLKDLIDHLVEKGWFEDTYIGIDERGFSQQAFDIIASVTHQDGQYTYSLKTAGAMDSFVTKHDFAVLVDDLNVGSTAIKAHENEFAAIVAERNALGKRTTTYTCTGHAPGSFSLSAPSESYWIMMYAFSRDTVGYLRWAYDSWVEDPLRDTTHSAFEPGDCFLIFPDEREAENPQVKSSLRLEKMAEGVRDVNKLMLIRNEIPSLSDEVEEILNTIKPTYATSGYFLSEAGKAEISADMKAVKQSIAELTEKYVLLKNGGTDEVERVEISNGSEITMQMGETLQLNGVVLPENIIDDSLTWSSSSDVVASVSNNGTVTANKVGTATITATSVLDGTKSASVTINIVRPSISEDALVSYYSFDKITDGKVTDEWGQKEGTVNGAVLTEGKSGNALKFTANDNVTVADPTSVEVNWSIAAWVNFSGSSNTASIFWDGNSFTGNQQGTVSIDARRDFSVEKMSLHSKEGYFTFNYTIPQNEWVHVTVTAMQTEIKLYINGEYIGNILWDQLANGHSKIAVPNKVFGGRGYSGMMDEVKIYNKALTADEVKLAMQLNGLNIYEKNVSLDPNDTYTIAAELISDLPDTTLTYESENPEIATVDENGVVTPHKIGSTRIIIKNEAGGFTDYVNIEVVRRHIIQYTIPQYDLPDRYLIDIERSPQGVNGITGRQYLGQPDMIAVNDQKLITVYPVGHGHGPLTMQVSNDGGETWTVKNDIPASWAKSQETPTLYKLDFTDGSTKLLLVCACPSWDLNLGGWQTSISNDDGETWSEFDHWHANFGATIVAMSSLIQLKDENGNYIDKWMGVFHNYSYNNYLTYLTFDENGNPNWSAPVRMFTEPEATAIERQTQACEVGMFRSPDGSRIIALTRSQSHAHPSMMSYSDDEGKTWSVPVPMQGALQGERHKAVYDPLTGRYFITFREITLDYNKNGIIENNDWRAGDWVAWIGTYEDLMERGEGQYRIRLDEDFAQNTYSGDTGYAGLVMLSDGTIVTDSYGHWDEQYSKNWHANGGTVTNDLCYIRRAKFNLYELENALKITNTDKTSLYSALVESKTADTSTASNAAIAEFNAAFENAVAVCSSLESTQQAIDSAKARLERAIEALANSEIEFGNVNGKDGINAADAVLVLQYFADIIDDSSEEFNIAAANVNGDDGITAADAALILQYFADIIDIFPVQIQ